MRPTLNILHLRNTEWSEGRYNSFMKELAEQGITDYRIWDGLTDKYNVRRAISKSHKQIVRWAKENNMPEVCIAEDDICFKAAGDFDFFMQNKPNSFDLYLGGPSQIIRKVNDLILDFRGLTLYCVNAPFYDAFLKVKEDTDIDHALKGLGKYHLCPKSVCAQNTGWSYHKQKNVDYSRLFNHLEKSKL